MPTYDYQCAKCDHMTEEFHSMSARPRMKCPECGGGMKRLLGTGAGIIFKGKGFYTTDYRSDSYKSAAKADTPTSSSSASAKDSSSSKPNTSATKSSSGGSSD